MLMTVLIAVLVFTLPGFIVSWISGLKTPWALAAAIPVSFGIFGFSAWLFGILNVRYSFGSITVATAIFAVAALVWRLGFVFAKVRNSSLSDGDEEPASAPSVGTRFLSYARQGGILDTRWLLPALGVITGSWLIIDRALDLLLSTPHGLDDIFQGWDVHWHASMVRFIDETGVASATRMGELRNIETQQEMFYPSAWHAGAWMVSEAAGISPIAATNLTGIVLSGLVLPLAAALIAWRLLNNRGLTAQIGAGFAGLLVVAAPVLFWVGHYVGAWPYVAAIGASGIVLALLMSIPALPIRVFAGVLAFIGMFQLHPAAVTIVVGALVLWWLFQLLWQPARTAETFKQGVLYRLRDVALLGVTGIIGILLVLPQVLSGSEQTEDVLAYSAEEDLSRADSWLNAMVMNTRHVNEFGDLDLRWLLIAAMVGAVVALIWRRNIWAPVLYFFSVALTVNALKAFPEPWGDWLNIVGGLHYSMAHRLVMPVALLTIAAAGIGIAAIIRIICLGPIKKFASVSAVSSVLLALVVAFPMQAWAVELVDKGSEFSIKAPHDNRMFSDDDRAAADWLIQQPRATELNIMGDPADGHGLAYAYNGLHTVSRHYAWPNAGEGSATSMLYWWPQYLGVGNNGDPTEANSVDQAATDLNVGFFFVSPWPFWGFQDPNFRMIDQMRYAPGVTQVYQKGGVAIYALNQAFSDAELNQMREPGNSPDPLPAMPTKGELGLAQTDEESAEVFYHRPTTLNESADSEIPYAPDPSTADVIVPGDTPETPIAALP